MTPLDIMRDAYKRAGVHFAQRQIGGTWLLKRCSEKDVKLSEDWSDWDFKNGEFMEFDADGSIGSY